MIRLFTRGRTRFDQRLRKRVRRPGPAKLTSVSNSLGCSDDDLSAALSCHSEVDPDIGTIGLVGEGAASRQAYKPPRRRRCWALLQPDPLGYAAGNNRHGHVNRTTSPCGPWCEDR